jgi:hypothetical protein
LEIEISFGFAVRENELQSARGCPEDRAAMGKLGAPSGVGEPNAQLDREKRLKAIRRGLNVSQPELLRWSGAGLLNLYVRLTANGSSEIHRFKRCPFCAHPKRGIHISKPWNVWYRSLPLVGI